MPRRSISDDDARQVLATQLLVRVAFHAGSASYLIPLGYAWVESTLCGVTGAGHKTEISEKNPEVSFQVDTSAETGLWEWRSVTGVGTFEIVQDERGRKQALAALQPVIAEAPEWWLKEHGPRIASGELLIWRITPRQISGCEHARS